MDESGNHHSQKTDTEQKTKHHHVLTHRQVLNNENTWAQGGEHHTLGSVEGLGARGWIAGGEDIGEG